MDDCGTADSGPSADCSSAPDTSTHCSSSVDPPPDYSSCVSHAETGSSNHHSGTTDTTHHSQHWHPPSDNGAADTIIDHSVHGIGPSAPFFDMTPGLESNSYNPQSSYMEDRSTTPRPTVHGRKTIVLTRTDDQIRARRNAMIACLCFSLTVVCVIPIVILISQFH